MKPHIIYPLFYGIVILTIEAVLFASTLIYFAFPCGYNGYPCILLKEPKIQIEIFIGVSVTILVGCFLGYCRGIAIRQTNGRISPKLKYYVINLLVVLLGSSWVIWSILHNVLPDTEL
jgi:hypothetical protein